jgi:protocatechuate 3,4-dioxygenase beta subunit
MQRRNFIKNTTLCAVAVSASGFIRFNGNQFEGDCETTTDILGPYYRPDAPLRTNLRIANAVGQPIKLSGQIKHKDCKTPLKNACVELWHCDGTGVYDNESPDFKYRAKTFCDEKGNYIFSTIIPVPYTVGSGVVRPAHFHMMFSAEGYQSLITQLYFTGDQYIAKDASASLPAAKSRILNIRNGNDGEKQMIFNVTMMDKIPADIAVIDQLSGTYKTGNGNDPDATFYRKDHLLWFKNPESINGGYPLQYNGNNTFEDYGDNTSTYLFTPQSDGSIKLFHAEMLQDKSIRSWEAIKQK